MGAEGAFEERVARLTEAVAGARHCVVLTGAGISTESGIPDFRSPQSGLWNRLDPWETLSAAAFWRDPPGFYRVALSSWLPPMLKARPGPAHRVLARLEQAGFVKAIITQNIDGLHQRAGSRRVVEVHGHVRYARCTGCGKPHEFADLMGRLQADPDGGAYCVCGGPIKPAVVLFGDPMPPEFDEAVREAVQAALMVVVGSSLSVEPAGSLPPLARRVAINNLQPTWMDPQALVVLPYPAGAVWPEVARRLRQLGVLS